METCMPEVLHNIPKGVRSLLILTLAGKPYVSLLNSSVRFLRQIAIYVVIKVANNFDNGLKVKKTFSNAFQSKRYGRELLIRQFLT